MTGKVGELRRINMRIWCESRVRQIRNSRCQRPNPDIAELHGLSVILKTKRRLFRANDIWRARLACRSRHSDIVLNVDAVLQDRYMSRSNQTASSIETRSTKQYVVRLPYSRISARINQRWILTVNRTGNSIRVRFVIN